MELYKDSCCLYNCIVTGTDVSEILIGGGVGWGWEGSKIKNFCDVIIIVSFCKYSANVKIASLKQARNQSGSQGRKTHLAAILPP